MEVAAARRDSRSVADVTLFIVDFDEEVGPNTLFQWLNLSKKLPA